MTPSSSPPPAAGEPAALTPLQDHRVDAEHVSALLAEGTYFSEARRWYHSLYHSPLADRCFFIVIILLAFANVWVAVSSFFGLLPLSPAVPFAVTSRNVFRDQPLIHPVGVPGEKADAALQRYFVENYVRLREEYALATLERNFGNIRHHSSEAVFGAYRQVMDPRNPESPIARYERQAVRSVETGAVTIDMQSVPPRAQVSFTATVTRGDVQEKTQWTAELAFRYTDIQVNQETGAVTPMTFEVIDYRVQPAPGQTEKRP